MLSGYWNGNDFIFPYAPRPTYPGLPTLLGETVAPVTQPATAAPEVNNSPSGMVGPGADQSPNPVSIESALYGTPQAPNPMGLFGFQSPMEAALAPINAARQANQGLHAMMDTSGSAESTHGPGTSPGGISAGVPGSHSLADVHGFGGTEGGSVGGDSQSEAEAAAADSEGAGGGWAAGGYVDGKALLGPNPPGPDDGMGALDDGEYVIKASSVKKYGKGLLGQINEGKISKAKLKGLLGC